MAPVTELNINHAHKSNRILFVSRQCGDFHFGSLSEAVEFRIDDPGDNLFGETTVSLIARAFQFDEQGSG